VLGAISSGASPLDVLDQALGAAKTGLVQLWRRKDPTWVYQEPHWVLGLNLAILILIRAGAAKLFVRMWLALFVWLRRTRDFLNASLIGVWDWYHDPQDGYHWGSSKDEAFGQANAWLDRMVSTAMAPVTICLVVSATCHILTIVIEFAFDIGPGTKFVNNVLRGLRVGQMMNYTLCATLLLTRILDARLVMSQSRPSLVGDLSNIIQSAPAVSRRYAFEAAITNLLRVVIITISVLLCLRHAGVNVSKLLAVTSISGVAFSFLLGDMLGNLLGGFVLFLTQPFAQGDWVQTADGSIDGWIQTMGWYYTSVMRWDKRPQYIPNSTFGVMAVVNCSRMTHRRILIEGPLRLRDLGQVEDILADVRNLVENHNDVDREMHQICRLKEVDDYSAVMWVSCYTPEIRLAKYLQVQESVLLSICSILRKYRTTWASNLERYYPTSRGEAELTSEFRRLLNTRSSLLTRERDLEMRREQIEIDEASLAATKQAFEERRKELEEEAASLAMRRDNVSTRSAMRQKRTEAVAALKTANEQRGKAIRMLERSFQIQPNKPDEALKLQDEALRLRERSVLMRMHAVVIERDVLGFEKDALKQETELINLREPLVPSDAELELETDEEDDEGTNKEKGKEKESVKVSRPEIAPPAIDGE